MYKFCFYLICLLFFLSGCSSSQVMDFPPRTLETVGPISINVHNFAGDVTVIVDETLHATEIAVTQRDEGVEDTKTQVKQIAWNTSAINTEQGEQVVVEISAQSNPLQTLFADVIIRAPHIHGVTAFTKKGDIVLYGITGMLSLKTSDGDVRVATPLVMNKDVTVEVIRGDIQYRVRGESSGAIHLTAINGNASFNLRHGEGTILPGSTGEHLNASFNNGKNQIEMRTVHGDIRFDVVSDPIGDEPLFNTKWISW